MLLQDAAKALCAASLFIDFRLSAELAVPAEFGRRGCGRMRTDVYFERTQAFSSGVERNVAPCYDTLFLHSFISGFLVDRSDQCHLSYACALSALRLSDVGPEAATGLNGQYLPFGGQRKALIGSQTPTMSLKESLSDDYVAGILKKDARDSSIKYSAFGLEAMLPKR